jgi:hypothetical protein
MVVHSIIITNSATRQVITAKFFVFEKDKKGFEKLLFKHVTGYGISETKQTIAMSNKYIAFEKFGDLGVYLTGMDDSEEEICKCSFALYRSVFYAAGMF